MNVVAVVPIKLNSKRLENKNIKCFRNGKPLCFYILNTLKNIDLINKVYVYCSDLSIKDYVPEGIEIQVRSSDLDKDSTKINEVLYEFANDVPADIYVMAHTTAPFISESSIYSGINGVISGDNDSAFSVLKVQDFFWKDGKPLNYNLNDIPRTQDLEIMYKETSGFYIYKRELIVSRMRRIGYNPLMVEVNEIEAIDIDEPEDFKVADAIYNNIIKRN